VDLKFQKFAKLIMAAAATFPQAFVATSSKQGEYPHPSIRVKKQASNCGDGDMVFL
jgi:hypothetical protein